MGDRKSKDLYEAAFLLRQKVWPPWVAQRVEALADRLVCYGTESANEEDRRA